MATPQTSSLSFYVQFSIMNPDSIPGRLKIPHSMRVLPDQIVLKMVEARDSWYSLRFGWYSRLVYSWYSVLVKVRVAVIA